MSRKRVLLSGVTSFTGSHIAEKLRLAGWEVVGSLTRPAASYAPDTLEGRRLARAQPHEQIYEAPFGSDALLAWLKKNSVDVFINHGSSQAQYRSPQFDVEASMAINLHEHERMIEALQKAGCQRFLHTGTFFEPDLGQPALSPYGTMKAKVWERLRAALETSGLAWTKIFIPNPIGPLENEDRLIPSFARQWLAGQKPLIKAPHLVRDNLPAPWLAQRYVEAALDSGGNAVLRPSGYVLSNGDFLRLFAAWAETLCQRTLEFTEEVHHSPGEVLLRKNTDDVPEMAERQEALSFWRGWLESLGFKPQDESRWELDKLDSKLDRLRS